MADILARTNVDEVRNALRAIVNAATGSGADIGGIGRSIAIRVGISALSKIQQAFVVKANGGTDEAGESWPDLDPKTKAYSRRFGPGEKARLKSAAGLGKANRVRGLMTAAQDKQWRGIYASMLARLRNEGLGEAAARAQAAKVAWGVMKKRGVKTALEVFGSRKVQILRDTGILFNSLSPGIEDKPSGAEGQVFEANAGAVIVGTNVPYAAYHHLGKRRLWPEPANWPESWRTALATAARRGVIEALPRVVT